MNTEVVMWGRTRHGRRWFWAARWRDEDDVPHVLCGWEDTEMAALTAGKRGAREITSGRPATLLRRYSVAADALREYNAEQCTAAHATTARTSPVRAFPVSEGYATIEG